MISDTTSAYIGTLVAVLFFGSNYVVTKPLDMGDGLTFQWLMCSAIGLVGYFSISIASFTFVPAGLLGGALWATGNLMVYPILELIGLGLGFLLWSSSNMIMGYFVGRFGLFGAKKESIANVPLNTVGVFFAFVSLLCYLFIDPPPATKDGESLPMHASDEEKLLSRSSEIVNVAEEGEEYPAATSPTPEKMKKKGAYMGIKSPLMRRIIGIFMALTAGTLYGVALVPFTVWDQHRKDDGHHPGPIDFMFSHYSGIWLLSSFAFVIYVIFKKNKPFLNPKMFGPSFICGVGWAIACGGWFYSQAYLGFTVGYPTVCIGPTVISSLWAIFLFGEMKGKKNISLLSASFVCVAIAVTCLLLSR
eukprot:TRINITY_DN168_c0_g1_i1.p1 TRINITY_DN168_c0_g1~~TRINITY_DN168_c0_g1_i1.p1  ORF type:complete len:361 (-),score=68.28 TRINITY_DN168_c0_g1_i1:1158-2240(-)